MYLTQGLHRAVQRNPDLEAVVDEDSSVTFAELRDRVIDYDGAIAAREPAEERRPDSEDLAVLMYTGGTTGRPKGVMLTTRQLLTSALGLLAGSGDPNRPGRYLHAAPLFHLAAFAGMLQQSILGSTHVLLGEFSVEKLVDTIEHHRITATLVVPTMIQWMLAHAAATGKRIDSLEVIGYGASPIPEPVLRELVTRLPHTAIRQGYGMTELAPAATILRDEDHRDPAHPERLRSADRAAPHTEVRVVDEQDVEPPRGPSTSSMRSRCPPSERSSRGSCAKATRHDHSAFDDEQDRDVHAHDADGRRGA